MEEGKEGRMKWKMRRRRKEKVEEEKVGEEGDGGAKSFWKMRSV